MSPRLLLVFMLIIISAFMALPEAKAFSQVGALTLNPGEHNLSTAVIDSAAGFAYFGTSNNTCVNPALIIKIRLSDFSRVGALRLNAGENIVSSAVIDPAAGFAYFGTTTPCNTPPAIIVKVRLSNFTRADSLTLNEYESNPRSAVIDAAAGYAYFGTDYYVVKIRLSDFTRVGALTLSNNYPASAVIDTAAGFAYFGTLAPGEVAKIRLSDFNILGELNIGGDLTSAVIDPAGGFVYFSNAVGGNQVGEVALFKIWLSNFSLVNNPSYRSFPQEDGEGAVIGPGAAFAYFGRVNAPYITKVRLSDQVVVDSIPVNGGVSSAVIDSATGFAYFGTSGGIYDTSSSPGMIVKLELTPPVVRTSNGVTFYITTNTTMPASNLLYNPTKHQLGFSVHGVVTYVHGVTTWAGTWAANITIPKSIIPPNATISAAYGNVTLTPQISGDTNNYYLYLTYHYIIHDLGGGSYSSFGILISFAPPQAQGPSGNTGINSLLGGNLPLVGGAVVGVLAVIIGGVVVVRMRRPGVHLSTPMTRA